MKRRSNDVGAVASKCTTSNQHRCNGTSNNITSHQSRHDLPSIMAAFKSAIYSRPFAPVGILGKTFAVTIHF